MAMHSCTGFETLESTPVSPSTGIQVAYGDRVEGFFEFVNRPLLGYSCRGSAVMHLAQVHLGGQARFGDLLVGPVGMTGIFPPMFGGGVDVTWHPRESRWSVRAEGLYAVPSSAAVLAIELGVRLGPLPP